MKLISWKEYKFNIDSNSNKDSEILGRDCKIVFYSKNSSFSLSDKHVIANTIKKSGEKQKFHFINNFHLLLVKSKKERTEKKDEEIILTRADKENTVIAIDKKGCISKTLKFLDPEKYMLINVYPTKKYQISSRRP